MRRKLTLLLFLILSLYPIKAHSEEIVFNPDEFTWLMAKDSYSESFYHTYSIPNYWCFAPAPKEIFLCWKRAYLPNKEVAQQLAHDFLFWSFSRGEKTLTEEDQPLFGYYSYLLLKYVYSVGDPKKLYIQDAPSLSWYIAASLSKYLYESTSILGYVCFASLESGHKEFPDFYCTRTYK